MDALKALMTDWISEWKVTDLYRAAQEARIPFAPINTMQQMYESDHLRERKFFVPFEQPGMGKLHAPGRAIAVQKDQVVAAPSGPPAGRA